MSEGACRRDMPREYVHIGVEERSIFNPSYRLCLISVWSKSSKSIEFRFRVLLRGEEIPWLLGSEFDALRFIQ